MPSPAAERSRAVSAEARLGTQKGPPGVGRKNGSGSLRYDMHARLGGDLSCQRRAVYYGRVRPWQSETQSTAAAIARCCLRITPVASSRQLIIGCIQ